MLSRVVPALLLALLAAWAIVSRGSDEAGAFARAVRGADRPALWEGLPHQSFERELLERERRAHPTLELGGYPFYREPLALAAADADRLTGILARSGTLLPFQGEKACGGFHPDYALEWRPGRERWLALLCFGCREAKVIGPGVDARFDLDHDAAAELKAALKPYRRSRPPGGTQG